MTIAQDILKSEVPAFVELFLLDLTSTNESELAGLILRYTPMSDSTDLMDIKLVMFGGETYNPDRNSVGL